MPFPLRIHVGDLLRAPGTSRRVSLTAPVSGLTVAQGGVVDDRAAAVHGRLDALSDAVFFSGTVEGEYRLECVRCLGAVEESFSLPADELFGTHITEDSDEGYPLRHDEIDLEPLVRDVVLLGVPLHPLCRPECAGLCAHCGADRNSSQCGCAEEEGHPALAALAELWQSRSS